MFSRVFGAVKGAYSNAVEQYEEKQKQTTAVKRKRSALSVGSSASTSERASKRPEQKRSRAELESEITRLEAVVADLNSQLQARDATIAKLKSGWDEPVATNDATPVVETEPTVETETVKVVAGTPDSAVESEALTDVETNKENTRPINGSATKGKAKVSDKAVGAQDQERDEPEEVLEVLSPINPAEVRSLMQDLS